MPRAVPRLVPALLPLRRDPWRPASGQLPGAAGPAGINLFDFGTIRVFPPSFVGGVIMLYEAVRDHDDEKAAEAYAIWGFRNLSKETMEVLNLWADSCTSRWCRTGSGRSSTPTTCPMAARSRSKVHEGLKRTGGVKRPARIPADGPRRGRPRQRLPAAAGGDELAPAVHGDDRGLTSNRARRAAGCGAGRGEGCRGRSPGVDGAASASILSAAGVVDVLVEIRLSSGAVNSAARRGAAGEGWTSSRRSMVPCGLLQDSCTSSWICGAVMPRAAATWPAKIGPAPA